MSSGSTMQISQKEDKVDDGREGTRERRMSVRIEGAPSEEQGRRGVMCSRCRNSRALLVCTHRSLAASERLRGALRLFIFLPKAASPSPSLFPGLFPFPPHFPML